MDRQDIKTAIDMLDDINDCQTYHVTQTLIKCGEEIAKLEKSLAECKRDAERYRWLRCTNWFAYGFVNIADYGRSNHETYEYLDSAIDAAIAAQKGEWK